MRAVLYPNAAKEALAKKDGETKKAPTAASAWEPTTKSSEKR